MFKIKRISIKVIAITFIIMVISFLTIVIFQIRTTTHSHLEQAVNRTRALTTFCETIRDHIGSLRHDNAFNDEALLTELKNALDEGRPYRETTMYMTVPVVGAWTAARKQADELGYMFRVPKNSPRNELNAPRPGLEQSVIDYLEGKGSISAIEEYGEIIFPENKEEARSLGEIGILHTGTERHNSAEGSGEEKIDAVRFFRSIKLTDDCMMCHGDPKGSKDLLGFELEGWKAGEVHGAFEIISPLNNMRSDIAKIGFQAFIIVLIVMVVGGAIFYTLMKKIVSDPVNKMRNFTTLFGKGDLSQNLDITSDDEIGAMAEDMNESVVSLRAIMAELAETTDTLISSSTELSTVSREMSNTAEDMNGRSSTVAAATEQVSVNVDTVASAAEESSSVVSNIAEKTDRMSTTFVNVASVARDAADKVGSMARMGQDMSDSVASIATAIEEMTASFSEVAKNTAQASKISRNANTRAEDINAKIETLVDASQKIGKVINVIKDIADQTNMLALNATIEAAGAGEAGKGFAVVAGEVKELARQSAEATDEIAGQIGNIQSSTNEAVQAIGEIAKIIAEIATINETIASSVEEQTATTNEIARTVAGNASMAKGVADNSREVSTLVENIASSTEEASRNAVEIARNVEETAGGVKEIARSSGEASLGVQDISKNIQGISVSSNETATGANKTNVSASRLITIADTLKEIVQRFKI